MADANNEMLLKYYHRGVLQRNLKLILLRLALRAEKDLQAYLKEKGFRFPDLIHFLTLYRSACENLILQDFEYCLSRDTEQKLWDYHGKVNNLFRKELKQFREGVGKKKPVEQRKASKHFLDFIKSSQRFYRGYIQRIAACFGGIPELEAVANRLTLSTLSIDEPIQVSDELGHSVLLSCHRTLVRLGDLSRWRETELVTKDRNWGPAIGYYDLARIIYPNSGASHNQLAVIALADGSHLRATYHLYRALAVEEPHPSANGNLEIEFKKSQEAEDKDDVATTDHPRDTQGSGESLVRCFMRLHARCFKGTESPDYEDDGNEVMHYLAINLKERSLEGTFSKLILINIAAQYYAGVRLNADSGSAERLRSFFNLLRVNAMTFFTLLQLLSSELERCVDGDSQTNANGTGSAKLSAVTRRVLPGLRQYSSWLISNAPILAAGVGDIALNVQFKELWKIYANALTLLISTFPVSGLPLPIEYLLEEDEDTLGFKPLDNEHAQRRYYTGTTGFRKPKWHDQGVHRQHPNIEMLGRVRDIIIEGMVLQSREDVPIHLLGTSLVYVEDAIPSTEDNHGVHTLSNFEHQEITHVEETTFPLDDRSREDLTSVSMDPASNRMVDDLVDSEIADDDLEQPSKPRISLDPTNEVGNETSYGLFGTSTASELEARADLRDQAPVSPRPPLPSIYNSPFAPQPGEATINSRPGTAKRTTPSHSRQSSQNVSHIQQSSRHTIESIQSSVPDPTNPNPPTTAGYRNQPHIEAKFTNKTNYTTGGRSSIVYGIDDYSALDACHFVSSAVEFGCSGSVRGAPNAHTPPNGQGAG